ncbi:hypothetical protein DsansV1_C29g0209941 [Dioscorea sansibarensis]
MGLMVTKGEELHQPDLYFFISTTKKKKREKENKKEEEQGSQSSKERESKWVLPWPMPLHSVPLSEYQVESPFVEVFAGRDDGGMTLTIRLPPTEIYRILVPACFQDFN